MLFIRKYCNSFNICRHFSTFILLLNLSQRCMRGGDNEKACEFVAQLKPEVEISWNTIRCQSPTHYQIPITDIILARRKITLKFDEQTKDPPVYHFGLSMVSNSERTSLLEEATATNPTQAANFVDLK
uniref:Uncharacterized protein n=1 Tax=Sphaerodactylus townsendi TaxID=933632 RepID=A0ACB8G9N3_9SAUR